jgi:asparagine synthase (glutamine-hydrolysing)
MADVPLGMPLRRPGQQRRRADGRQIDGRSTPSPSRSQRAFSELDYARQVAGHQRRTTRSSASRTSSGRSWLWHEDEPIAHPSSVPLHFLSALARAHVKVVLTGEGSDELLAGYGKYPRSLLNWKAGGVYERLIPGAIRTAVAGSVVPRLPGSFGRLARRSFLAMPRRPADMFLDNFAGMPLGLQHTLLESHVLDGTDPYAASLEYFHRANGASGVLDRLLYTDIKTYLVELLMKQDQMSMSMSIESRVPFLDHVLVEFAARLPHRLKLGGLTTKRVLRGGPGFGRQPFWPGRVDLLPPRCARNWNGVAREVLLDRRTCQRGLINPAEVARLLDEHRDGRRAGGDAIWALMNLELWYRTFIDGDGIQTLPVPGRLGGGCREADPPRAAQRGGIRNTNHASVRLRSGVCRERLRGVVCRRRSRGRGRRRQRGQGPGDQ